MSISSINCSSTDLGSSAEGGLKLTLQCTSTPTEISENNPTKPNESNNHTQSLFDTFGAQEPKQKDSRQNGGQFLGNKRKGGRKMQSNFSCDLHQLKSKVSLTGVKSQKSLGI